MDGATGILLRALAFAAERHSGQRRKDAAASPYINHPIALADVLANEGRVLDVVVLSAAMLHDTIEDTCTTADELALHFGPRIAAVVVEVSDDRSICQHAGFCTRGDTNVWTMVGASDDDGVRADLEVAEATIRDRIRSPLLQHPALTPELARLRRGGVHVLLLGEVPDDGGPHEPMAGPLAAAVVRELADAEPGGSVVIRRLPDGGAVSPDTVRAVEDAILTRRPPALPLRLLLRPLRRPPRWPPLRLPRLPPRRLLRLRPLPAAWSKSRCRISATSTQCPSSNCS